MHHPWKFATVVAVALAFTACTDSARNPITEPNGIRLTEFPSEPLTGAKDALRDDIYAAYTRLLSCSDSRTPGQIFADLDKMVKYAERGWYQTTQGDPWESVKWIVENKLIPDTDKHVAGGKKIGTTCSGQYSNSRVLADEIFFLLNAFAENTAEYDNGTYSAFICPAGAPCNRTGNGWKVEIPVGAYNEDVLVVVRPFNGNFTGLDNQFGNGKHFDVFGASTPEANFPWKRWICVATEGPTESVVPPSWVVMVRQDEGGNLDYLPTEYEFWENTANCTPLNQTILNKTLRGARTLLAGFPLFPRDLHAYSPPRTFGGTSTAASPHKLAYTEPVEPPAGFTLQDLYALTQQYYGDASPNQTAALGKLQDAIDCTQNTELTEAQVTECVNTALQQYINNVRAQTGKQGVTVEEGEELIGLAFSLKQ